MVLRNPSDSFVPVRSEQASTPPAGLDATNGTPDKSDRQRTIVYTVHISLPDMCFCSEKKEDWQAEERCSEEVTATYLEKQNAGQNESSARRTWKAGGRGVKKAGREEEAAAQASTVNEEGRGSRRVYIDSGEGWCCGRMGGAKGLEELLTCGGGCRFGSDAAMARLSAGTVLGLHTAVGALLGGGGGWGAGAVCGTGRRDSQPCLRWHTLGMEQAWAIREGRAGADRERLLGRATNCIWSARRFGRRPAKGRNQIVG
jgi:hypothetical protein